MVATDGAVVSRGRSLYSPEGERLWAQSGLPKPARNAQRVVARADGVSVLVVGELRTGTATDLTVVGVADDRSIAWTKQIPAAHLPLLSDEDAIVGELPAALAIRTAGPDDTHSNLMILDVASGAVLADRSGTRNDLYSVAFPVSESVLTVYARAGDQRCVVEKWDAGQVAWTREVTGACTSPGRTSLSALSNDAAILELNSRVLGVGLDDGTNRWLSSDEIASNRPLLTGRTSIRRTATEIRGTDILTGKRLWARDTGLESYDLYVDDLVVLKEPTRLPNPVARTGLRLDQAQPKMADRSRRIVALDPRTGEVLGSAIDPVATASDTQISSSQESVVVTHSRYGPAYRIAAGG